MITPPEIKTHEFTYVTDNSVNKNEVKAYLAEIAQDYEELINENKQLYQKLIACISRLEEYQKDEQLLRDAQMTAKDLADKIIVNATQKANSEAKSIEQETIKIMENSQAEIQKTLDLVRTAKETARQIIKNLNDETNSFKQQMIDNYHSQISSLENSKNELLLNDELCNIVTFSDKTQEKENKGGLEQAEENKP